MTNRMCQIAVGISYPGFCLHTPSPPLASYLYYLFVTAHTLGCLQVSTPHLPLFFCLSFYLSLALCLSHSVSILSLLSLSISLCSPTVSRLSPSFQLLLISNSVKFEPKLVQIGTKQNNSEIFQISFQKTPRFSPYAPIWPYLYPNLPTQRLLTYVRILIIACSRTNGPPFFSK